MLLGGVVFVKTYNVNADLLENVEALAAWEYFFSESGTTVSNRNPYTYEVIEYKYYLGRGQESDWMCNGPSCMNIYSECPKSAARKLKGCDCSAPGNESCTPSQSVEEYHIL